MTETPAEPDPKPPRFPYVAAILCAGCLAAAAWTWMRYSYAWDITSAAVDRWPAPGAAGADDFPYGAYVVLRAAPEDVLDLGGFWHAAARVGRDRSFDVQLVGRGTLPPESMTVLAGRLFMGRLEMHGAPDVWRRTVSVGRSRFHPASIAGLVVGAMGVFVFTVALRHWLNQRRASHVGAVEAET